jgi:hypothetical protein
MDADGLFQTGPDEGSFLLTVAAGGLPATASVAVAKPGILTPTPVVPPVKQKPTGPSSASPVPARKWMNVYAKALSKFAASKGSN